MFCSILAQAQNTNYGTNAGNAGTDNTSIGYRAGDKVTGTSNVFLGYNSGLNVTTGYQNVFIGRSTGFYNTVGRYNVFIGSAAGQGNTGEKNVFIGFQAGFNETGSAKLYIDNSSTSSPLIYGDFDSDFLRFNGNVGIGGDPSFPLHVTRTHNDSWSGKFTNGNANVYLAHQGGYGIFINTGATNNSSKYALSVKNQYQVHLYVQDDGQVGFGTNSPAATLDVRRGLGTSTANFAGSQWTSHFSYSTNEHTYIRGGKDNSNVLINDRDQLGNVGIGTGSPSEKLEVAGKIRTLGINGLTQQGGGVSGENYDITGVNWLKINDPGEGINFHDDGEIKIIEDGTNNKFYIGPGNVGIGTTPTEKLDVAGNIRASGALYASGGNSENWNTAYTEPQLA